MDARGQEKSRKRPRACVPRRAPVAITFAVTFPTAAAAPAAPCFIRWSTVPATVGIPPAGASPAEPTVPGAPRVVPSSPLPYPDAGRLQPVRAPAAAAQLPGPVAPSASASATGGRRHAELDARSRNGRRLGRRSPAASGAAAAESPVPRRWRRLPVWQGKRRRQGRLPWAISPSPARRGLEQPGAGLVETARPPPWFFIILLLTAALLTIGN